MGKYIVIQGIAVADGLIKDDHFAVSLQSLIDLMSFLDTILPLSVHGAEGVMKPVRAAFVESVTTSMGHYFRSISNVRGT